MSSRDLLLLTRILHAQISRLPFVDALLQDVIMAIIWSWWKKSCLSSKTKTSLQLTHLSARDTLCPFLRQRCRPPLALDWGCMQLQTLEAPMCQAKLQHLPRTKSLNRQDVRKHSKRMKKMQQSLAKPADFLISPVGNWGLAGETQSATEIPSCYM